MTSVGISISPFSNKHQKKVLVTIQLLKKNMPIEINLNLKSPSIPLYERGRRYFLPLAKGGWEGFYKDVFKPINCYKPSMLKNAHFDRVATATA
jgi:hypothetical protein